MRGLIILLLSFVLFLGCSPKNEVEVVKGTQKEILEEKSIDDAPTIKPIQEPSGQAQQKKYYAHFINRTKANQTYNHIYHLAKMYSKYFTNIIIADISTERTSPTSQSVTVFSNHEMKYKFAISTAKIGKVTPSGFFNPTSLYSKYRSHAYGSQMPNSIFYLPGIALHGVYGSMQNTLGLRASAGCLRMHPDDIIKLQNLLLDHLTDNNRSQLQLVDLSFNDVVLKGNSKGRALYFERTRYKFKSPNCSTCTSYTPYKSSASITENGNIRYVTEDYKYIEVTPTGQTVAVLQSRLSNQEADKLSRGFDTLIIVKDFSGYNQYQLLELIQDGQVEVSQNKVRD